MTEPNINAGCTKASELGYTTFESQTVVELALNDWNGGNREKAVEDMLDIGISAMDTYSIIVTAVNGS